MINVVDCVIPGVDLALSLQVWLALEREHSSLGNRVYFHHVAPAERRSRRELLTLSFKTHRLRREMVTAWQETLKLRGN